VGIFHPCSITLFYRSARIISSTCTGPFTLPIRIPASNSWGFIDFFEYQKDNAPMPRQYLRPYQTNLSIFTVAFLTCALNQTESNAKDFDPDNPLNAPAPIYWCPEKTPDQQIATKQKKDCRPLYDKHADESFRAAALKRGYTLPVRDPIKIVALQN